MEWGFEFLNASFCHKSDEKEFLWILITSHKEVTLLLFEIYSTNQFGRKGKKEKFVDFLWQFVLLPFSLHPFHFVFICHFQFKLASKFFFILWLNWVFSSTCMLREHNLRTLGINIAILWETEGRFVCENEIECLIFTVLLRQKIVLNIYFIKGHFLYCCRTFQNLTLNYVRIDFNYVIIGNGKLFNVINKVKFEGMTIMI